MPARKGSRVMVGLRTATHVALRAFARSLEAEYQRHRADLPDSQADGVSLDYAVRVLLERVDGHRVRAARQRDRRRGVKPDPRPADGGRAEGGAE